ncbi:MAG: hypothetical protein A3I78_01090 [Gammaproteobacteria bacterium RIFCSPLOWO2_02_FULL_56_15]|nr:MAG: hypothetical protein A3I78_01090 [Gammaproteobacteria bacterium RIFCSPLOWO2_02_FULL_56_15]
MYRVIITFSIVLFLSACGTMPSERAVSGAGLGAAAGTIVGAVTGLSLFEGAALGAVGGALTGVLTDDDEINFGTPAWEQGSRNNNGREPGDTVMKIQYQLSRHGYDAGPQDGVMGPKTQEAIRQYQKQHGLLIDGRATPELAAHMQHR